MSERAAVGGQEGGRRSEGAGPWDQLGSDSDPQALTFNPLEAEKLIYLFR